MIFVSDKSALKKRIRGKGYGGGAGSGGGNGEGGGGGCDRSRNSSGQSGCHNGRAGHSACDVVGGVCGECGCCRACVVGNGGDGGDGNVCNGGARGNGRSSCGTYIDNGSCRGSHDARGDGAGRASGSRDGAGGRCHANICTISTTSRNSHAFARAIRKRNNGALHATPLNSIESHCSRRGPAA
eukprot:gnl/MRDRNA2_/MRDRNA2_22338_c0_seq1.p2 gnl/MRDRNA2_/MRDRNA2_22338_c0~~gnl/MRDRNA2_/MRDRNA2_22338_c0_seq1.p2  ORF type:complete len:184 (+),score=20.98 gnl/MRDRNA2_/MRDRNA2_22338_c0_seq1:46-597(+)